jgi:hypothetical protein
VSAEVEQGALAHAGLPEVLRPLVREQRTGPLRLSRGKVTKTLYLSEGRLIFATSTDPDDRLGEMLLRKGIISYRALEDSVRALQAGKRQGTLLVENGAIRARDLVEGVTEQVQEIIYSLFHWDEGRYEFQPGDLPSREVIVLRMSTGDLVMEGIRRVARWSRIRAGVGPLDQRYALSGSSASLLAGISLPKHELELVAHLDGVMTLEEICKAGRSADFQVCRTVWALWAAGVLDRVPQDVAEGAGAEAEEDTSPHAEVVAGASVGREIDRFNQLHRFLYDLVSYELRERAAGFFERAFSRASSEHSALFLGVAVDESGELDPIALRRNVVTQEIASYLRGLERLLEIEGELVLDMMGEKKSAIIQDGLLALREQQLQAGARPA